MYAPNLFGVVFEKKLIKRFPETVDIKVLQRIFFPLENRSENIATTRFEGAPESHIGKGLEFQRDGIVEELVKEINA